MAMSAGQQKVFRYGVNLFDIDINTACGIASLPANSADNVSTTESQAAIAKTIIGIAKTNNLGRDGALIGLMVGLTETHLVIYANSGIAPSLSNPNKQATGNNYDSLGVFQQRIATGWSTLAPAADAATQRSSSASQAYSSGFPKAVNQLMDPSYNAEAFFGSPKGSNAPAALSKGLQNLSNWQSLEPWVAAQRVQASAFGDGSNYKEYLSQAQSLLNQYWDDAPAVPLPVPFTGAGSGTTTSSSATCAAANCSPSEQPAAVATDQQSSAVRQAVVCLAQQEYQLWENGSLKPGTDYHKYSQNRDENWCGDFASWVYNQAGYPLTTDTKDGNVAYVPTFQDIGVADDLFHYHDAASYTPRPGDLAIHGSKHVNIVTAVKGSTITLIGGNQATNDYTTSSVTQYDISSRTSDGITGYVSPD
jgi:hypothetical protein